MIGKLTVFSIVETSRPDGGAVLGEDLEPASSTSSIVPDVFQASARSATVRRVFFGPDPPIRIGRCAWIGRGAHQRVVERVAPGPRGVNRSPSSRRRISITDSSSRSSASRATSPNSIPNAVVLALEPGAADAQDRAPVREVVEGRRELGGEPGVAERVGADHQAEADPLRDRGQAGQHATSPRRSAAPTGRRSRAGDPRSRSSPSRRPPRRAPRRGSPAQSVCCDHSWSPNCMVSALPALSRSVRGPSPRSRGS